MTKLPAVLLFAVLGSAGAGYSATLPVSNPTVPDAAQRQDMPTVRSFLMTTSISFVPKIEHNGMTSRTPIPSSPKPSWPLKED